MFGGDLTKSTRGTAHTPLVCGVTERTSPVDSLVDTARSTFLVSGSSALGRVLTTLAR